MSDCLTVAVWMEDREYMTRLIQFVKDSNQAAHWEFIMFTNRKAFIEEIHSVVVHAVIVDERLDDELRRSIPEQLPVITLVQALVEQATPKLTDIVKYQPIPQLLKKLKDCILHTQRLQGNFSDSTTEGSQLICISSTVPRAGKTIFALHLAEALSSNVGRCFYLNLEMWNSISYWIEGLPTSKSSMSDFLYMMKVQPQEAQKWLQSHVWYNEKLKCDMLQPFRNQDDRILLSREDAIHMITALKDSGMYEYIIIDLDAGLGDWQLAILELCETVFMLTQDNPLFLEKHSQLMKYTSDKYEKFAELQRKCITVLENSTNHNERNNEAIVGMPIRYMLPNIEEWNEGSPIQLLSSSIYRAAVQQCVTKFLTREL